MTDDILGTLTCDSAQALTGHTYRVQAGGQTVVLTITRVVRAAERGPRPPGLRRDAFSIFFAGPAEILLPQRMYTLEGDSESFPNIFIVPVGRTSDGYEYEAVFT